MLATAIVYGYAFIGMCASTWWLDGWFERRRVRKAMEAGERFVREEMSKPERVAARANARPMSDAEYIDAEIIASGAVPPKERAA